MERASSSACCATARAACAPAARRSAADGDGGPGDRDLRHAVRARPRAQSREPRAAVAGRVPRAQRARLPGQDRRAPRAARVHLSRVRGALPPARVGARARAASAAATRSPIMAPNVPAMLEAHYAVPALGAVLNALNSASTRATIAFCLAHGEAQGAHHRRRVRARRARRRWRWSSGRSSSSTSTTREGRARRARSATMRLRGRCSRRATPRSRGPGRDDEWDALALLYTSGTTGDPKGVVYHHRGAYLNALGNALAFGLAPDSVYLWTLPMFHCSGWTYTWAVTAVGGTHVCLRRVDPALIFPAIRDHRVTHLCGAPIVLNLLVHAPDDGEGALRPRGRGRDRRRRAAVGGHRGDGDDGLPRHAPLRPHRVATAPRRCARGRTSGRRCR